jgi:hypothetical protein
VVAPMTGGCLCGAVRYESTGEPGFALLCHCRDCQRQSGSAFAAGWRVPAAGFRVTQGEPKLYLRAADSGNEITRAFCPDCGTMLFLRVSARPDLAPSGLARSMIRAGFALRLISLSRARSPGTT